MQSLAESGLEDDLSGCLPAMRVVGAERLVVEIGDLVVHRTESFDGCGFEGGFCIWRGRTHLC
jgi:hypothetical protein